MAQMLKEKIAVQNNDAPIRQTKTLLQKQEYIAVDLMRFVLSFLIVALHFSPMADTSPAWSNWIVQVLTRFAVPFFFLASGYFAANKVQHVTQMMGYIKRLLALFLVYNVIYLPLMLYRWRVMDGTMKGLKESFYLFFINGIFEHLWFFLGLAVAMVCLFLLRKVFSCLQILVGSMVLYLGAMFCVTNHAWLLTVPKVHWVLSVYYRYFYTMRNGVFFGLPLVAIGYAVYTYRAKIRQSGWYFVAFVATFFLMQLEVQHKDFTQVANGDMYWTLPLVALFCFLWVCSCSLPKSLAAFSKTMRQISVMVYGFHMMVYYILIIYWYRFSTHVLTSLQTYLIVCCVTFLLSFGFVKLSRCKGFSWLKYLY